MTRVSASLVLAAFGATASGAVVVAFRSGLIRSRYMARAWFLLAGILFGWGVVSAMWIWFFPDPLWDWVHTISGPMTGAFIGLLAGGYAQRYIPKGPNEVLQAIGRCQIGFALKAPRNS